MVAQEAQIVLIQQYAGSLHFDPAERISHELEKQPKIRQELPVLLRLCVSSQHDGIAPALLCKFQPFEIVFQVQVKEWQIVVDLILERMLGHVAHTEAAVVYTALIWDYDTQRLCFHFFIPPKLYFTYYMQKKRVGAVSGPLGTVFMSENGSLPSLRSR